MSNCDWCECHVDDEEFICDELVCRECYEENNKEK